ncbi:MAG: TlpA disulfide reductase family protein [Gammaproteobacteria bacterium]|nr:TlpA disulfide reductase family protein [Gammaproteobacteria bacterium]
MLRIGGVSRATCALGLLLSTMPAWAEVYRFGAQDVVAILQASVRSSHPNGAAKPDTKPGTDVAPTDAGGPSVQIIATRLDRAAQLRPGAPGVVQLAPDDILRQLPAVLGIVPDMGDAGGTAVDPVAVFGVSPASGDGSDTLSVTLAPTADEAFRITTTDHHRLAEWLRARSADFLAGNIVLERVDGFDAPVQILFGTKPAVADKPPLGADFNEGLRDLVGRSLAEVSFTRLDGETRRLADVPASVLLVHVWATWCAPCIADMPILEALESAHAGLRVVNLSDEPAAVINEWLAENPTGMLHGRRDDFAFLAGDGTASPDGSVVAVRPVHLVLDREAVVLEVGTRGATGSSAPNHLAELVEPYL